MKTIMIAAMGYNHVIGVGEDMPWDVPEEYQHFLNTVEGHTILMGRVTFLLSQPHLKDTHNLVVSRSTDEIEGAEVFATLDAALERAEELGGTLFIGGGGTVYAQALPFADEMHLSYIPHPTGGDFEGNVYFPAFDRDAWAVAQREDRGSYTFVIYRRRSA
ncbi:MAG: dihydrofolate reductase [Bacteroidota bacterium]